MADYRLTQTGAEVQDLLNRVPTIAAEVLQKYTKPVSGIPDSDLTQALQLAIAKALTSYQKPGTGIPASDLTAAVQNLLNAAGTAYQKPGTGIPAADMATAVQNLLNLAGSAYQKPVTGIPLTDLTASVQAAINAASQASADIAAERAAREQAVSDEASARIDADATLRALIQQVTNSLINYYLKSETYSRSEVNALINAIRQFQYKVVDALPTASADTVGFVYLIPSTNPKTKNVKEEYITISEESGGQTTYSWEHIGSTNIDLSGYYTSAQVDALLANYSTTQQMNQAITNALNTALASYYTKAQVDAMNTAITNRILFLERGLGKYDNTRSITLQQATAGKYVNVNGQEVSASGYGISAEVQLNAGDIMLVPSAEAVPADVSLFARIVTRTYQKVINYAYTYRQDYPELPATATADYDQTLVYTAQYDETGDTPVLTGWTRAGQTYTTLPATREVTESYYEPLMKQAVAAMPSTGYYVYLCPTSMTIVVSGYTATVNGGVALVVGLGIFKNIATNFIGAPGQAVLAQAFAQLIGEIDGLKAQLDNLGETRAVCVNSEEVPKVQNYPMIIHGSGAPAAPNVPAFIGQKYLDTTNKKEYTAFSVTNSVSDWVLIN